MGGAEKSAFFSGGQDESGKFIKALDSQWQRGVYKKEAGPKIGEVTYTREVFPKELVSCVVKEGLTTHIAISGLQASPASKHAFACFEALARRCDLMRAPGGEKSEATQTQQKAA